MKIDTEQLKQENPIETVIGRFLDLKKDGSGFKACCPFHDEKTPSFNVNTSTQTFKCFGCGEGGDVIEFIAKHKSLEFKEACEFLGAEPTSEEKHIAKPKNQGKPKQKKKPAKVVPLSYPEKASAIFTTKALTEASGNLAEGRTLKSAWKYFNEKSEVELVVCRWENPDGKKTVLTYYYDGKQIRMKSYPVLLYNRDKLSTEPEKDVLIVFGEKCADVADSLGQFIAVTWNGGEKKVNEVDFGPLENRTVYVWPDDDQQKYVNGPDKGKMMPPEEQPGNITAAAVLQHLPHAQVVEIIPELREIEPSGADIVEALEYFGGDIASVTHHIYETAKRSEPDLPPSTGKSSSEQDKKSWPFEILGIADDGKAYFIGSNDRMLETKPTSISRNFMMALIGVDWWRNTYGKDKEAWEDATSDLIHTSSLIDFDPDRMRGRGAWREPDGRICYHDGQKTTGEFSTDRIYLRRSRKDIGLTKNHATAEQRKRLHELADKLSFKGTQDCIRMLAWAIISPFAGALEWRPAALLTADSQSGKSTIINRIIKPLSGAKIYSGGGSTEPGVRQNVGIDTVPVVLEEFEADTPKKKQNRDEILSLMRQSTSDDSPPAAKGTQDGKGMNFVLRSMFCFVGIDPAISSWADENRLFRAELGKPRHTGDEWEKLDADLKSAFSEEICAGVRAHTWAHLDAIITLYKRVARFVHHESSTRSIRTSKADAILLATFLAVVHDNPNASDEQIKEFVSFFYESSENEVEEPHDENVEMLEKILNHTVRDGSDNFSLRDLLSVVAGDLAEDADPTLIKMNSSRARRIAGDNGIGLDAPNLTGARHYAIAKNHQKIMRILDKDRGYYLQLARHPKCIRKSKNVGLGSRTANCVVIERVVSNHA